PLWAQLARNIIFPQRSMVGVSRPPGKQPRAIASPQGLVLDMALGIPCLASHPGTNFREQARSHRSRSRSQNQSPNQSDGGGFGGSGVAPGTAVPAISGGFDCGSEPAREYLRLAIGSR